MSIVLVQPAPTDDTDIHEAFAFVASKLPRVPNVAANAAKVASTLQGRGVYCVGVLRLKKYTPMQMDTLLSESGLDDFRSTLEYALKITFENPDAPEGCKVKVINDTSSLKPSRFMEDGEDLLGKKLKKLNLLKNVVISPRISEIILAWPNVTKAEFDETVNETVLFTLKTYSMVNVDAIYLDRVVELLPKGQLPPGKDWFKSLFHKFNNAKKEKASVSRTPLRLLEALIATDCHCR